MYQRLRRDSLRIRSFMTSFLKRLSKASCDSPSLKVTVANTLTSFRILSHKQNPACVVRQWIAAGFARLWLLTSALMPVCKVPLLPGTLLSLHDVVSPQSRASEVPRLSRTPTHCPLSRRQQDHYSRFYPRRQRQNGAWTGGCLFLLQLCQKLGYQLADFCLLGCKEMIRTRHHM